ncbi:MAG: tetratricopeptide repeat protein [Rhodocyclaceae bacterium]|jgi:MSHA biogenesis protein MshN|nr:tetratricopeptide repeat protein [Rhodocyclaceae bacterium]
MSVINQMLRDLDARQASKQERAGLPPQLRTLPPLPETRSKQWLLLAGGMAAGALIAGVVASVFWGSGPASPTAAPVPAPPAASFSPPPPTSMPPQVEEEMLLPFDPGAMKLSTQLMAFPEPLPVHDPVPAPAPEPVIPATPPPIVKPKPEPAKPAPLPAAAPAPRETRPAATPSAPPPPAELQIEKRSRESRAHDQAEGEYNKGVQAVRRGDSATALQSLQRALEFEPTHVKARQALLSVLVGSKQWTAARQVAQTGLAVDPTQSGLAAILARLQFEQGDTAAALDTLTRHAAHATGNADFQGLFAYLLQKQQRPAEAAQRFQAALALRPNEGRWWFGLGMALESANRGSEAKEAYAKAREVGNMSADMASVVEQKLR